MSQVARPATPSLGIRLRSHKLVWLTVVLVAIASAAAVIAFVPGSDDSSQSNVTPNFQPGVSAPHPDEGRAPIQQNSGAYTARPEEGQAPVQQSSSGNSYNQRPQEGQAPIQP